jgi:hypothetical protein
VYDTSLGGSLLFGLALSICVMNDPQFILAYQYPLFSWDEFAVITVFADVRAGHRSRSGWIVVANVFPVFLVI